MAGVWIDRFNIHLLMNMTGKRTDRFNVTMINFLVISSK